MAICVKEIIEVVNGIAPFALAEKWDNSGLQAGDPDWPVRRVLVALDVTPQAMDAARESGCDLLLTHHPLVMSGEKRIDFSIMPGSVIQMAAVDKIAVVSAHTNLDKAENGLNDFFAQKIGMACTQALCADHSDPEAGPFAGIGRLGTLENPMTLRGLAEKIKTDLGISGVRVTGNMALETRHLALCTGSGGSLTHDFLKSDAQVYVTGDLKYHEARDIESQGKAAIDVGHFASEQIVVDLLKKRLSDPLSAIDTDLEILEYRKEKDPFTII